MSEPTREPTRIDAPAGRLIPVDPDALLFEAEAAYLTGLSIRTLQAYRVRGGGPEYFVLGRRAVRYRRREVMAWLELRRRRSTSDPGPDAGDGQ